MFPMETFSESAAPPACLIRPSGRVLRLILLPILLSFVLWIRRETIPRAETRFLLTVMNMVLVPVRPSLLVILTNVLGASRAVTGRPCPCTVCASLL